MDYTEHRNGGRAAGGRPPPAYVRRVAAGQRPDVPAASQDLFEFAQFNAAEAERGGYSNYSYWMATLRAFFKNRVAVFFLIVMVALLAFTYEVTGVGDLGTGLTQEELAEYAPVVLPESDGAIQLYEYDGGEADLLGVYVNDSKDGVALHIQTVGYGGKSKPIEALIGLNQNGEIQGIAIVSSQETPGLGTKIEDEEYLKKYQGISGSADSVDTARRSGRKPVRRPGSVTAGMGYRQGPVEERMIRKFGIRMDPPSVPLPSIRRRSSSRARFAIVS